MAGKIRCSYGDDEPVWCGVFVGEKLIWVCKKHYRLILSKLEGAAEVEGSSSLDSLSASEAGGKARVKVRGKAEPPP